MKALKFLGVAVLACSMLFVSCKKEEKYTITVKSNNEAWGTVTGGGSYAAKATATLTATAKDGYEFVQWNDGNKENPRNITVTKAETYTATFQAKSAPAPEVGSASVVFGTETWEASIAGGYWYATYGAYTVAAYSGASADEYPIFSMASYKTTTGSASDQYSESKAAGWQNEVFSYLEYYDEMYLSDGTYEYGDWWGKTATLNVTAFDATELVVSATLNAVMFSAYEAFVPAGGQTGMEGASTKNMSVNMNAVELQEPSSKAIFNKKFNGKLFVK